MRITCVAFALLVASCSTYAASGEWGPFSVHFAILVYLTGHTIRHVRVMRSIDRADRMRGIRP
jgi:hypothetical protein